jgi:hypothetical protein
MSSELPVLLYVLDTHVLIWYFTGNRRLPEELKNRIDLAIHGNVQGAGACKRLPLPAAPPCAQL